MAVGGVSARARGAPIKKIVKLMRYQLSPITESLRESWPVLALISPTNEWVEYSVRRIPVEHTITKPLKGNRHARRDSTIGSRRCLMRSGAAVSSPYLRARPSMRFTGRARRVRRRVGSPTASRRRAPGL